MKNHVLVRKYAQGLVRAVKTEEEFHVVTAEIRAFLEVYEHHDGLRKSLLTPFLDERKKKRLLEDVLAKLGLSGKTARFLSLLLENKRLELVCDIGAVLPETWNEKRGVVTYEVTSVVPLTDNQKTRLKKELEALEKKPVTLVFKIDAAIVGGLSLRKGHVVYDASVEGHLDRIKEQIQQG